MPDILRFAHQPIVDRRRRIVGSEVLFRSNELSAEAVFGDAVAATRHVLGAIESYRGTLFEGGPIFVNVPRQMILDGSVGELDPRNIGVEILEDVVADPQILRAVADLRRAGFLVALDDFLPEPSRVPLLAHADIVKLDVRAIGLGQLEAIVEELRRGNLLILAEKVETDSEFERCLQLGFDLFQGYAVGRPKTIAVLPAVARQAVLGERRAIPWLDRRRVVDPVSP